MMELAEKETSAAVAMWYRRTPIQVDVLKSIEETITKPELFMKP